MWIMHGRAEGWSLVSARSVSGDARAIAVRAAAVAESRVRA
jgi:hypothetical protein